MPPHKILGIKGRKGSAKVQGPKKHTGRMTAVFTIRADATRATDSHDLDTLPSDGFTLCKRLDGWMPPAGLLRGRGARGCGGGVCYWGPTITKNYFGLSAARWTHRSGKRLRAIKATISAWGEFPVHNVI
ncbi:hypothetical protein PHMEG_00032223 [Phytophthora megakarya]|uniref:Uncharacterized protein n=1 Tax=Phytophthora megakarya TaxID=4795 RepID=A0A225UWI1_9STRA|nr:hypothetical protein PHMEG_00032223 [Phytophthora megakarya]